MKRTCKEIRRQFIEFFEARGHTLVPSSSLLPGDDPTLLFANAGMNQFKDIFLGRERRKYVRAANSQKCIRAGGKHNDLEDVGHDTSHHTFFEMLGNWSFGDYFKAEAIHLAWELLTEVWGLPKERLYATVFGGDVAEGLEPDSESGRLWREVTDINPSHISEGLRKDNFWEMGQTGPCGPCSEIHIDLTDDGSGGRLVNAGDPRVIELWNLVFIQYDRNDEGPGPRGKLAALPERHVDTGMGLERLCAVLGGKKSNYASDLFVPIIKKIEMFTEHRYGASGNLPDRFDVTGEKDIADVACRVIADHTRALSFAIADGIIPSNEGRGYVLRRILRRAGRYGRQYLKIDGPFLAELVPTIVELMGEYFTELPERQECIIETIRAEEVSFGKTLDRGIELFEVQAGKLSAAGLKELPGDVAFDLYATYGFPVDLTQIMAAERGMTVDVAGYDGAMARHRELSGSAGTFEAEDIPPLPVTDDSAKYRGEPLEAKVLGWVLGGQYIRQGTLSPGDEAAVVLDRTNFYGEAGGQVGDAGYLQWEGGRFAVRDTQLAAGGVLHIGLVEAGSLRPGASVRCLVDASRRQTTRNHTATHLLNWALRRVLGDHINQAGSVVAPDRLRFDFSHNKAMTAEQLEQVERLVNDRVLSDEPVVRKLLPLAEAKKIPGVRAVFGETYPDPVRLIAIGTDEPQRDADENCAIEFCGGTHLERTSQVGLFTIVSEESVAKGVRRITALTGPAAVGRVQQLDRIVRATAAALRIPPEELPQRVAAMQKEIKQLKKRRGEARRDDEQFSPEVTIETPEGNVLIGRAPQPEAQAMRNLCDRLRQKGAAGMLLGGAAEGKVMLVAMVSEKLAALGLRADEWLKAVAPIVGGGGGGRATLAQAGGKLPDKLAEALVAAAQFARNKLN